MVGPDLRTMVKYMQSPQQQEYCHCSLVSLVINGKSLCDNSLAVQVLISTSHVPWAHIYTALNGNNLLLLLNCVTGDTTLEPENG